jgi:hypothetical protein
MRAVTGLKKGDLRVLTNGVTHIYILTTLKYEILMEML